MTPWPLPLPFTALLPAFLLALGAGLVSGTPGGLGAFEVTLLALLPEADPAPILAAILAWRLTYHALPALLAAAVAIKGSQKTRPAVAALTRLTPAIAGAELGLVAQGTLSIQTVGAGERLVGRTGQFMVALFGPSDGATVGDLAKAAHAETRLPVLYKCNARLAVRARVAGFVAVLIAREAWLCPHDYGIGAASRAGLRRKTAPGRGGGRHCDATRCAAMATA